MRKLLIISLIFTILFTQVVYALPTPGNADYVDSDMDFIESYAIVNNIPSFNNTVKLTNKGSGKTTLMTKLSIQYRKKG